MLIASLMPLLFKHTTPESCFPFGNSTVWLQELRISYWRLGNRWFQFSKTPNYIGFWGWLPSDVLTLLSSRTPIHARNCAIAPSFCKCYPSVAYPPLHPQSSNSLHLQMGLHETGKSVPSLTSVDCKPDFIGFEWLIFWLWGLVGEGFNKVPFLDCFLLDHKESRAPLL